MDDSEPPDSSGHYPNISIPRGAHLVDGTNPSILLANYSKITKDPRENEPRDNRNEREKLSQQQLEFLLKHVPCHFAKKFPENNDGCPDLNNDCLIKGKEWTYCPTAQDYII